MIDINFKTKVKEISSLLKSWQHRKLTLLGKITVIKTLASPKIIHLLTALPNLPESKLNNLNSIFYNFIWNSKPDKIKRNTMIGHFMKGGLDMIHLQSFNKYLKISWIKRLVSNLEGSWHTLLLTNSNKYGHIRAISLHKDKLQEIAICLKNPFWKDVFMSLYYSKKMDKRGILSLDVLNFIHISDFSFYENWEANGVKLVHDIIDKKVRHSLLLKKLKI